MLSFIIFPAYFSYFIVMTQGVCILSLLYFECGEKAVQEVPIIPCMHCAGPGVAVIVDMGHIGFE